MNTGAFFFFLCFFDAPPSPAVRAYILSREKGSTVPLPSSTMKSNFVFSRSFPAFIAFHYQVRK